jgi:hypothetical protein
MSIFNLHSSVVGDSPNPMNRCRPSRLNGQSPDPLEALVQTYLQNNAESVDRYLQYYRIPKTLAAAVSKAAMAELPGRKRFSAFCFQYFSFLPRLPSCRSLESAIKLAERFIAGLSRHSQATADATKPRPAAPQPEATPAPVAEPVAA